MTLLLTHQIDTTSAHEGQMSRALSYDAVVDKGKRKAPDGILRSEDAELTIDKRRKLISGGRDLGRNFALGAWMLRKHLDYVSAFTFQAKTGDKPLNKQIERWMTNYSRKRNCDAAGRHPLPRLVRLIERMRTMDGDVLVVKLANGCIQVIEGDRVRSPYGMVPSGYSPADFIHGVVTNPAGADVAYAVNRRGRNSDLAPSGGTFVFERMVPAKNAWLHGYFDRIDQVRGISPLAPAINTLRDVYEGADYALAKMKVAQLFGLQINRGTSDPIGTVTDVDPADPTTPPRKKIDFGNGPIVLDFEEGEDAKFLESHTPSTEFQTFASTMIGVALKALDIPFSFYAENFTNFSGQRQAWIQYDMSARHKRQDNIDLLNELTEWRLQMAIDDGELPEFNIEDCPWDWLSVGVPWIDPLREVQADVQALAAGLASRTGILRDQGQDFEEIAHQLAEENKLLTDLNLPTSTNPANVQITEVSGAAA